jgi:hypothetical protein
MSVFDLESNIPIYLAKLFDSLISKKGIQLIFLAASGVTRDVDGADEMIELDIFLDIEEAHVACGYLLIYLLRFYKDLLFNIDGIGGSNSTGNIRITAAVFLPGSFPKKSEKNVSMADYEANFDELVALGKDDSEIIYSETIQREQQINTNDFKITVGSSLDVKIRNVQYSDYRVYQEDEGLKMLKKTPSHFKPDVAVREFIGILYCMIKFYKQNRLTNCTLGGDSIRKVDQMNCDEAGNYYHLTLPGIPTYDVNIIKSLLLNLANWKAKGFKHLGKLEPITIDRVALRYPDLKRIYQERKEALEANYDEYPPVFDKFGNLDIDKTFEYGKLFAYMGWQLKSKIMEKYKCECNSTFVTKGKF